MFFNQKSSDIFLLKIYFESLPQFSANANPLLVYLIPFLECTQEHHSSDSPFFLSVISFLLPSGSFSPSYKHIVTSSILKQEQRQPPLILLFFLSVVLLICFINILRLYYLATYMIRIISSLVK